jgi:hypothetical protein
VQPVRSAERRSNSKENTFVIPGFREKIFGFVQADAIKRE